MILKKEKNRSRAEGIDTVKCSLRIRIECSELLFKLEHCP